MRLMSLHVREMDDALEFRYREPINRFAIYKLLIPPFAIWFTLRVPAAGLGRYIWSTLGTYLVVMGTYSILKTFVGTTVLHFTNTQLSIRWGMLGIARRKILPISTMNRPTIQDESYWYGMWRHRRPPMLVLRDRSEKDPIMLCNEFNWCELEDVLSLLGRKFPSIAATWDIPERPNLELELTSTNNSVQR